MNVTFVFPDLNVFEGFSRDYSGIFSHGIGYLSASLKENGHTASLIHVTRELDKREFIEKLKENSSDLIAFTMLSHQFKYVKKLVRWAKEATDAQVICGGIHATIEPDKVIQAEGVDMLCRGEGEAAIVELCDKLSKNEDAQDVKNIWLKKDGKIIKNDIRCAQKSLNDIPFADRKLFSYTKLYDYKIRMLTILGSRGCPFDCSYCCNHQYQKLYPSGYVRFRSVDNVLSEIDEVLSWYSDCEFINFIDDTLCLNKDWMVEFSEKYPKAFALPFHGNVRIEFLTEDMVKILKRAGCERLTAGIESGDFHIRQEILNRKVSDRQIYDAFNLTNKYGIKLATYNMVGVPFEDMPGILKTIKMNAAVKPCAVNVAIFQPYPHTRLYDTCLEHGFISKDEVSTFSGDSVINQPQLSRAQAVFAHAYFPVFIRLYELAGRFPARFNKIISGHIDRIFIFFGSKPIILRLRFLINLIVFPIKTVKGMIMMACPVLARRLKYLVYGRHYMGKR